MQSGPPVLHCIAPSHFYFSSRTQIVIILLTEEYIPKENSHYPTVSRPSLLMFHKPLSLCIKGTSLASFLCLECNFRNILLRNNNPPLPLDRPELSSPCGLWKSSRYVMRLEKMLFPYTLKGVVLLSFPEGS